MRIVQVVLWRKEGNGEKWIRGYGDRWQSSVSGNVVTSEELIAHVRTLLEEQTPPTPEERATDAYRNCFLHSKNGYSDEDCISVFAQAIREAIQADREAR